MERNIQPLLQNIKSELQIQMNKPLIKGETWHLVDYYWLRKCKAYVGFEGLVDRYQRRMFQPGAEALHPGPIDNKALFKDAELGELREHLVCEWDYSLVTKEGWNMLVEKFTVQQGQTPVARKVVEYISRRPGTSAIDKHCRVDVYGAWPGNVDWNQNEQESRTSVPGKIWPRLSFGQTSAEYCRLLPRNARLSSNAPSTESASSLGPLDTRSKQTAPLTVSESSKTDSKPSAPSTGSSSSHSKQTAPSTGWQWHGKTVTGASNVLRKQALTKSPYVQCRKHTINDSSSAVIKKTTASASSIVDSKNPKKPNVMENCQTCKLLPLLCTHDKLAITKGSLHGESTKLRLLSTAIGSSNADNKMKDNSVSAHNVKGDVERTNEEIVEKLLSKIDVLNKELMEQSGIEAAEMAELDKEFQEALKALKTSKENFVQEILNKEKKEVQELRLKYRKLKEDFILENYRKQEIEQLTFLAKGKSIAENRSSIKTAIEEAVCKLTQTLNKVGDNALEVNIDFKKDMECPVCFDEMKPPSRIFQCTNGHLICGGCKEKMKGTKCPTCKEAKIMGRAVAMEQLARTLYRQ